MIIVENGQTLLDVAIQHCGDAKAAFEIARMNGLSITDAILPGSYLNVPDVSDAAIVRFFATNNYIPATALKPGTIEVAQPQGIGNGAIGLTFKVS